MAGEEQRLDGRFLAVLCLAAGAALINNTSLGPFIPEIARDFDSTVPRIGQAATASWLMAAFAGIFAGPLADHYGHRRILIGGLALTVISALAGAAAPNYWTMVGARVLGGFGFTATIGIAFAVATTRYSGGARLRALSVISASLSLAGVIGIPVLTTIAGPFSWRGAWVFVALLTAIAILLLVTSIPAVSTGSSGHFDLRQLRTTYAPLLRSLPMLMLFGGTVFHGVMVIASMTYVGSFYVDDLGLTVQQFGLISIVTGSAFLLGSVVAARLGRFDLRFTFAWTTVASGILLLGAFSVSSTVIVATVLLSLSYFLSGIQVVNIMTLVSNETPSGQATTLVVNEALFGIGAATGAAAGGLLIALGGFTALGLGMPVFGLLAAISVWQPWSPRASRPVSDAHTLTVFIGEDES